MGSEVWGGGPGEKKKEKGERGEGYGYTQAIVSAEPQQLLLFYQTPFQDFN